MTILQCQTSLEKLTMKLCALTDDQKLQIRKALAGREVEIDFGEEKPPSRVIPMAVTAAVGAVAAAAYFFMKKKN